MTTENRLTLAGIGCGSRTRTYLKLASELPASYKITAVADPAAERCQSVIDHAPESDRAGIRAFSSAEEFLSQPRLADVVIIGTQDHYHYEPCKKALELGYDVLLEKPIAQKLSQALELSDLATRLGRRVDVCHVLRYTPFYQELKKIIDSGELGQIITFNANEGVGAWHFAHSFTRGHWGNMEASTPMILAKCCHDMDILYWLMGRPCERVASFGELSYFRKESLSEPRPLYCTDWTTPIGEDPYDARKYATEPTLRRWLGMVYDRAEIATDEEIYEWLSKNKWGRDAFQCDNDQPDHQVLMLNYKGGLTGTFTMTAFEEGRHIEIYGTKARLRAGAFYKQSGCGEIVVTPHFGEARKIDLTAAEQGYAGHGGGDWGLMQSLYGDMTSDEPELMSSSIQQSVHSHLIAFAAEHARRTGEVISLADFEQKVRNGELDY